jgi:hypothetical protein
MDINQKQNNLLKYFPVILFLLISIFGAACDSVIYYQPKDWTKEEHPWFTKSFGDFDIKITDIGGITIEDSIIPEITIHNRGKSTAILEGALLKAGGKEYSAHPFGNKAWEAVPSNETRRLALEIEFSKSIDKILKDPIEIILVLKIGEESKKVSIPMIERKLTN